MNLKDNHLDELFRERLGNFTPEPPAGVWGRIQEELDRKKRVRRILFYRWAGAAAVLFLALLAGVLLPPNLDKRPDQAKIEKQTIPQQTVPEPSSAAKPHLQIANASELTPQIPSRKPSGVAEKKERELPVGAEEREIWLPVLTGANGQKRQQNITLPEANEIALMVLPEQNLVIALPIRTEPFHGKENTWKAVIRKERKPAEWELGLRLSPAYASQSTDYSSSYAQNLSTSGNSGQTGLGGGFSVGLKTSRRWKVESGLYYSRSELGRPNNSVFASADADYYAMASATNKSYSSNRVTMVKGTMAVNTSAGLIRINQVPEEAKLVADLETAIGMNTVLLTPGDFSQVFDYLELPLTAHYQILDGKMELELQTGVSANFVVGNQVFIGSGTDRQYFGKTSNISQMGFSGIAGLGISYPLSKHFAITIEPRASYWLNSLNNSGDVTFKPWKIGVYSGLTFGF
ncbi:MAG TPA: hypothetical protein PLW67_02705 [Prolixibacteraceae bacterium]|nr:hypothetical protein [Prolixibacteraceae bacterium]